MTEPNNGTQREIKQLLVQTAQLATSMENMEKDIKDIKESLKNEYVTRKEFEIVQRIVFGLVTLILLGVASAVVGPVIAGGLP